MSIPRTLREELKAGRVVPFVGAGVSMAVQDKNGHPVFPSWRHLLESCAECLEQENKSEEAALVRACVAASPPDYLYAAQRASQALGTLLYDVIEEKINVKREIIAEHTLDLAKAIWDLKSNLIVTTNYDRILEWACSDLNVDRWDIESVYEKTKLLSEGVKTPTVWHLHGHVSDKANLILTPDSFTKLYGGESHYPAALETLRTLLVAHRFIFIGFSLDDEYLGGHISDIARIFKDCGQRHYILVKESDKEHINTLNLPVEVVTYKEHGQPLLHLLRECAQFTAQKNEPKPSNKFGPEKYVFNVPFRPKGDQVVGRESALQQLRQQLLSGKPTSIGQTASFHGLGGLGKTQLAIEYAYRFKSEYPNGVVWITADQDIEAQLTELVVTAGWVSPETEYKYKLDIARQRLKSYEQCLIIFDNIEEIEVIRPYLPLANVSPHIIVTSRENHLGFKSIPLELLNVEQSRQLLLQESETAPCTPEEEEALSTVIVELGGLPLALELAGAFVHYRSIDWQVYRQLLEKNLRRATEVPIDSFTKHEADLYSTLQISQQIFEDEPLLKEIVEILTWSASAPMGASLLASLLGLEDTVEMDAALSLGVKLNLLRHSGSGSYSLHRLIGRINREKSNLLERAGWAESVCQRIGDWFQERRQDYRFLPEYELEINHLRAWQECINDILPVATSRLLWLQAYLPYHRGDYLKALTLVEKAIQLLGDSNKEFPDLYAHLLHDTSALYGIAGNNKLCFERAEKALSIRIETNGEKDIDTALSFNCLAQAYGKRGDYHNQLKYYQKSYDIFSVLLGEKHRHIAMTLNNIGAAYGGLGRNQEQLEYFKKGSDICVEIHGTNHPDTATSFNNLGAAYGALKDYESQLKYQRKSYEIFLNIFGERHPDTAKTLNNLGSAYNDLKDEVEGIKYIEKSLSIRLDVLGEEHPETAISFHNLGCTYFRREKYIEGIELIEKAIEIQKKTVGEKHPHIAIFSNSIASAYEELGDFAKMYEYAEKGLEIRKEILGNIHPHTLYSVKNTVTALRKLGKKYEAFQLLDNTLRVLPRKSPYYKQFEQQVVDILRKRLRRDRPNPSIAKLKQKWNRM